MKYKKALLLAIIALGLFLRIFKGELSPPGLNADEAAYGYNAYSIIKTGKDEWGASFPLILKSFSDYKAPLYSYLDIPFIALFGLNSYSLRLPSVIFGVLTILIIYLLAKEIYQNEVVALSSAFLLSTSPWHVFFSRAAWENNVATFFISLGVLSLIWGLRVKKWLFVSSICFVASIYTYQSPKIFVPLFLLIFLIFYRRKINLKKVAMPVLVGVLLLIPLIVATLGGSALQRFQGISFSSDIGPVLRTEEERNEHQSSSDLGAKIYHNRVIAYSISFIDHYFSQFSPDFLFISGDPIGRDRVPGMGQMYLFESVFLVIGLYYLSQKKSSLRGTIFIWLLISAIPAALTFQTPHADRAQVEVIPLVLISAAGSGVLIEKLWRFKTSVKLMSVALLSLAMIFFIGRFTDEYFIHLPRSNGVDWEYGFPLLTQKVFEKYDKYQKIVITDRYDQPYIMLLFYSGFDPNKFIESPKVRTFPDRFGFTTVASFDKFQFRKPSSEEVKRSKNTLFVISGDEDSKDYPTGEMINFPSGKVAFKIIST